MINFTYMMLALIIVGIVLACIPKKLYTKSQINWNMVGMWLIGCSFGTICTTWVCYLIYSLGQFIWPIIIMMWGEM